MNEHKENAPQRGANPASAVLALFDSGSRTLDEVSIATGLPKDIVEAVVEQLVRMGKVSAESLTSGCPTGGCGSCSATPGGKSCVAGDSSNVRLLKRN